MIDINIVMFMGLGGFAIGFLLTRLLFGFLKNRLDRPRRRAHWGRVYSEYDQAPGSEAALKRGKELLFKHLTPEQTRTLKKHGWFEVKGGSSGKTYRIHRSHTANVVCEDWVPGSGVGRIMCFGMEPYPGEHVLGDHLLAQKICLEVDEEATLKVANL